MRVSDRRLSGLRIKEKGLRYGQCFQSLPGETGALNLGQRWEDPSPTATLYIDLRTVTSAASSFDFRTFDPEGVIFYGDTNPGKDWFVLALRKGKPEMQIHNAVTNLTVSGGMRLNDGRWHRLMVKNEGDVVIMEVDGDDQLVLRHVSSSVIDHPVFAMRIGVGGLFIPAQELLTPLNTAMDGCMRRWNWLNKTSEWREGSSLEEEGTKVCFPSIRPGSFFPGNGLATFSLADLPTGLNPANGNWSLALEMRIEGARKRPPAGGLQCETRPGSAPGPAAHGSGGPAGEQDSLHGPASGGGLPGLAAPGADHVVALRPSPSQCRDPEAHPQDRLRPPEADLAGPKGRPHHWRVAR
nr:PREDICTED: sex hormone-binding globulin [Anolis carolinensis]|eukprot:XP_016853528.1 PREDICTED: sex hormone-binding globulin [Anolis carolinensis]